MFSLANAYQAAGIAAVVLIVIIIVVICVVRSKSDKSKFDDVDYHHVVRVDNNKSIPPDQPAVSAVEMQDMTSALDPETETHHEPDELEVEDEKYDAHDEPGELEVQDEKYDAHDEPDQLEMEGEQYAEDAEKNV